MHEALCSECGKPGDFMLNVMIPPGDVIDHLHRHACTMCLGRVAVYLHGCANAEGYNRHAVVIESLDDFDPHLN